MLTIVYLVLGLAFMGGLFYALMQITARQRRLNAELTRLERLAAEVSMNAEAILDRVDERADGLNDLLERAEARVTAAASLALQAPVVAPPVAPAAPATPAAEEPKKKRTRKAKQEPAAEAVSASEAAPAPVAAPAPASIERYQRLRTAARTLADQGKSPSDIAAELGLPRGEVLLLLNLRSKKVTA